MTEQKWTPGPWKVYGPNNHPNENMGFWRVEGVANVANDVTKHDAHLIAAAPELYDALLEIVTRYHQGGDIYGWIDQAGFALAKARGEE